MLSLLQNNFVIAAVVSIILVGFIVSQNKNREDKPGFVFYVRCFALSFILLLVVLYFKTGDLSLPSMEQTGGATAGKIPFNPISATTPFVSTPVSSSIDTVGRELGLNNVNLDSPGF